MKTYLPVLLVLAASPVGAESSLPVTDHAHHQAARAETATATGVIRKINTAQGTLTIAHEAVPALGWPAMVMPFRASAGQMAAVRVGERVRFEFTHQGMATLVRIDPAD